MVDRLHNSDPGIELMKSILSVPEFVESVSPLQLRLWRWISEYYMCTMGEVMDAALPSGLKLESLPAEEGDSLRQRYRPRTISWVGLKEGYSEAAANQLLNSLSRAFAQKRILETYLEMIDFGSAGKA